MLKRIAKKILPVGVQQKLVAVISIAPKIRRYWFKKFVADRKLRGIRRSNRNSCWCGGQLSLFRWHPSYGVCVVCGSYVNRYPPLRDDLRTLYSFDLYWHIKQKADGLPEIEKRPDYDKADGRVEFWLELIKKYAPPKGRVIEIGCAHGVLLKELQERGYDCIGVEIDKETAIWTSENMGVNVVAGFFPGVELPSCDLFLSFDVLEHSPDPEAFMRKASQILRPGGIAIIQTAADRYDYVPPFGPRFKDAFDDIEHLFIFTDKAMLELARRAQLKTITLSERIWLMGEIFIFGKDVP